MGVEAESVTWQRSTCPHQSDHNPELVRAEKADACWVFPNVGIEEQEVTRVPVKEDVDHRMG